MMKCSLVGIGLVMTLGLAVSAFAADACNDNMGHTGNGSQVSGNRVGSINGTPWGFEQWYQGGNASMTYYSNGTFKANWSGSSDYLTRVGYQYNGNGIDHKTKNFAVDYKYTKTGNASYGYIGVYGWTKNPETEYYIVDDWYSKPSEQYVGEKFGEITVDAAHSPEGVQIVTTPDDDMINNILTIPNHRLLSVTLKKVSAESEEPLLGAKFSLTKKNNSVWKAVSGYDEIDLSEDSQVTISSLDEGLYRLEETESPAGYVIISKFIYLKVDSDGQISLTDESGTGANENREAELTDHETEGYILTVKNVSGMSLPSTGGPGTCIFYILGGICVTLAWICIMMRRRGRFSD